MKRKVVALLTVAAMACTLLAGCGSDAASSDAAASSAAAEEAAPADEDAAPAEEDAAPADEAAAEDAAPAEEAAAEETAAATGSGFPVDADEAYYMCVPVSGVEYWYPVFQGMKEAANALGVKAYYMGTPEWDDAALVEVFDQIMAMNPTGILCHPTSGQAFVEPIQRAIDSGVQVVTFAADSPESARTAYVTSDNNKEGAAAAKGIGEALNGEGSILVMRNPGQTNHETRDDSFIAYIHENFPNMTIYEENSGQDVDKTYQATMTTYQKDPNLKAVFTPEASSAAGAAQAGLEIGGGEQALLVSCCDTSEEVLDLLKEDKFFSAIAPDQYLQGYMGMLDLYFAKHNEILRPMNARADAGENLWQSPFMDNGLSVVTKENADNFYLDDYAKSIGLGGGDDLIKPLENPTGEGFGSASGETYYMAVPVSGVEYWYPVMQGMKDAAEKLGVSAYYMGTPEWDDAALVEVFDQILAMNPTGIVCHPTSAQAFVEPIQRAVDQGVQVVTFAADSPESARTAYVTSDNTKEGNAAAKQIGDALGGEGSVLVMRNPGQTNHELRDDSFIAYLNENYPNMVVYEENSGQDVDKTYQATMTTYQKDPNLKAVFTPEASSAAGAAQAGLEIGNGEQALLIACCDTSEEVLDLLQDGKFFFAIAPDQYLQGYMAMLNAYFAAHNEILHPMNGRADAGENLWQTPYMDNGLSIVTKENAASFYLDDYAKSIGLSGGSDLVAPYEAE